MGKESLSPRAAPVVLMKKKQAHGGSMWKLHTITHKDAYPLPRIQETLMELKKAAWYSTLELASG